MPSYRSTATVVYMKPVQWEHNFRVVGLSKSNGNQYDKFVRDGGYVRIHTTEYGRTLMSLVINEKAVVSSVLIRDWDAALAYCISQYGKILGEEPTFSVPCRNSRASETFEILEISMKYLPEYVRMTEKELWLNACIYGDGTASYCVENDEDIYVCVDAESHGPEGIEKVLEKYREECKDIEP